MKMEHRTRQIWCEEISQINRELNHQAEESFE